MENPGQQCMQTKKTLYGLKQAPIKWNQIIIVTENLLSKRKKIRRLEKFM